MFRVFHPTLFSFPLLIICRWLSFLYLSIRNDVQTQRSLFLHETIFRVYLFASATLLAQHRGIPRIPWYRSATIRIKRKLENTQRTINISEMFLPIISTCTHTNVHMKFFSQFKFEIIFYVKEFMYWKISLLKRLLFQPKLLITLQINIDNDQSFGKTM